MKTAITKRAAPPQNPVFSRSLHQLRPDPQAAPPHPTARKRDNIFSKSRDTREDRGTREMKTTHNPQSFPHER